MEREQVLAQVAEETQVCTKCALYHSRKIAVPGIGPADAKIMFIGEGPGFHENEQGKPFVGAAGRFLDELLQTAGMRREDVFITNVVKCRPPGNRDPKDDEVAACAAYLDRQIDLIQPKVIVALGKPASRRLTGTNKPMGALRGRWSSYRGIPLIPVFHPAYLLRQPKLKREAWEDLKLVMRRLQTSE